MTPFATAISDYVANIKTAAEGPVTQTSVKTFNAAVENFIGLNGGPAFLPADDTSALAGAGADWGVSDRAQLWADVAQVEDDYRNLKVDGREG